ncbi:MAG: S-layer homology domain-containing protein, partial [Ruminococcaceae bacterium]|nr:S-layer homology domain-containing protein [Oscillospiraceae bacterium]
TEVTWEAFGVDSAKFKADFTAEVEPHIPEIKVTAPTPVSGKGPDDAKPALTTTGMHFYAWDWRDSKGNVLTDYDIFKGGETYTLTVVVASTEKFLEGKTKAYINDTEVTWEAFGVDSAKFKADFTATGDKLIDSLSLTVTAPEAGKNPVFNAVAGLGGQYTIDTAASTVGVTNGVGWARLKSTTWDDIDEILKAADKFETGKVYMVCVAVKPNSGYSFDGLESNPTKALVNGQAAAHVEKASGGIFVYYVFPPLAETEPKTITDVAVTLAAPKAGEKAAFTAAVPANANYALKSVSWFCDEDDAALTAGDTFADGKTYILNVSLTAKEGFSFGNDIELKGKLNGDPAQARRLEDGSCLVTKYFTLGLANPFTDVKQSDYFYDAVIWAYYAEPQVTNGIGGGLFGPNNTVKRCEAVTFLWRAVGCPEPTTTKNPFEDVKESDYYYKPVLWAVEKGITVGTDATHFTPEQTCSTAHIITFLYRTLNPGQDGWYAVAEGYARGKGLLDGLTLKVEPGVDCPRRDVVLFLYRAVGK